MRMKIKKSAVALGICMGILAPLVAMIPTTSKTEAAIAVFDADNIAKTVEEIAKLVDMINLQKDQITQKALDMSGLDDVTKDLILKGMKKQKEGVWDEHQMYEGIGKSNSSVEGIFKSDIGDIEALVNGNMKNIDLNVLQQKRQTVLSKTNQDAAKAAKSTQQNNEVLMKNIEETLQASQKAEGTVQAIQADTAMNAVTAQATIRNTELLGQLVQMEAVNNQSNNFKQAAEWQAVENTIMHMADVYKKLNE